MTAWGIPVTVWPRDASEISEPQRRLLQHGVTVLQRVKEDESARATCHELVKHNSHGNGWVLSEGGRECFDLLTYVS